jgi:nitrogen fixation protein FixH
MNLDSKALERRSARFWSLFVLALMSINLLVALVAIVIAIGDPSFQPMPSYGAKSIDWEAKKQLQLRSDALGWTARVERNSHGNGIRVHLADSSGAPVAGASGTVQAYHFTRADESVTVPLNESSHEPGAYLAEIDVAKDGRWQVSLQLARGDAELFLMDSMLEWYR